MTQPKHGTARKVWLFIAHDEGAWNSQDAATEIGSPTRPVQMALSQGARRGFYVRHPGRPVRYSVDTECKVPYGVKLGEVPKRETV